MLCLHAFIHSSEQDGRGNDGRRKQVKVGSSQGVSWWWILVSILLFTFLPFRSLSPFVSIKSQRALSFWDSDEQLNSQALRYFSACPRRVAD